jgi:hypothetical protein
VKEAVKAGEGVVSMALSTHNTAAVATVATVGMVGMVVEVQWWRRRRSRA